MVLWNCALCGKKKSTFIKNQDINRISNDKLKMNKSLTNFY